MIPSWLQSCYIAGSNVKVAPVDADSLVLIDSEDSDCPKVVTWACDIKGGFPYCSFFCAMIL